MKLSAQYNQLRQKTLAQLTELVLANRKPCSYLDGREVINFEVGRASFLAIICGELYPINLTSHLVELDTISLIDLINFVESYK